MTLRIAKLQEPHRPGKMLSEISDPSQINGVMNQGDAADPEPEVVGIPGLVREMIGRFSCNVAENVRITNGYNEPRHSPTKHPKPPAVSPVRSAISTIESRTAKVQSPVRPVQSPVSIENVCARTGDQVDYGRTLPAKEPPRQKASTSSGSDDFRDLYSNAEPQSSVHIRCQSRSGIDANDGSGQGLLGSGSDQTKISSKSLDLPTPNRTGHEISNDLLSSEDCSEVKYEQTMAVHLSPPELVTSPAVPDCINPYAPILNGDLTHNSKTNNDSELAAVQRLICNGEMNLSRTPSPSVVPKDGRYFLGVVQEVESHLRTHSARLEQYLEGPIPDEASGKIRTAVGKANLLVTKKFKQFRELCNNNLMQPEGESFVTTAEDLGGFWDMVQLQVDDVQRLFDEINHLQARNWVETVPEVNKTTSLNGPEGRPKEPTNNSTSLKKTNPKRVSEAAKAREEARKRLMAAKMAGRQRKASETEEDVQIFIS